MTTQRKIHWTDLVLIDGNYPDVMLSREASIKPLIQFRREGCMDGVYFKPMGLPHEVDSDASTYGPQLPDDVDWQDFADLERLHQIMTALEDAAVSRGNPCGALAYYHPSSAKPWVIADDWHIEQYATIEEAIAAAGQWAEVA